MQPGMFQDSSGNKRHMQLDMASAATGTKAGNSVKQAADGANTAKDETAAPSAWVDFCHVLLNTSEFFVHRLTC